MAEVGVLATPGVVVEESPPESIKLKRFPSVYRGVITEVGMMMQSKDSREFETFGVRYRTQEGIVEAVFGANLRTALQEANAAVGDEVEILKIGRKTIEKGKAPMNLFNQAASMRARSPRCGMPTNQIRLPSATTWKRFGPATGAST